MLRFVRYLLALLCIVSLPALAAGPAFEQARFDTLQKEGKPILVVVHADWCPICKAQGAILKDLLATPELKPLNVLTIDFDKQKNALHNVKATMQSTLIVYKGGKEVDRSTGETRKEQVSTMLRKAL